MGSFFFAKRTSPIIDTINLSLKRRKTMRVEVWFNNGLFRGYPNVDKETMREDEDLRELIFEFGEPVKHQACINMNNVNFIEFMEEEN